MPNVRAKTLRPKVKDSIVNGATVYTDALPSYNGLGVRFSHRTIDHLERYVDGQVHANTIENFLKSRQARAERAPTSAWSRSTFSATSTSGCSRSTSVTAPTTGASTRSSGAITGRRLTFAEVTGQR